MKEERDEEFVETWPHLFPERPLTVVEPDQGRTYRTMRKIIRQEHEAPRQLRNGRPPRAGEKSPAVERVHPPTV